MTEKVERDTLDVLEAMPGYKLIEERATEAYDAMAKRRRDGLEALRVKIEEAIDLYREDVAT